MTVSYDNVWRTMNELETVTSKICSAREILDSAIDAHQEHKHEKVEHLLNAVDEFLQYYLAEFDEKFKDAWKETVVKLKNDVVDDGMRPWGHSDIEYSIANHKKPLSCDKDDLSPECQGAWNSFWEEDGNSVVGNPVAAPASPDTLVISDKIEHSEYYYDYGRNDSTRLNCEAGWVYESPDGGKTVTKRKVGSTEKIVVREEKVKKWILPVEEVRDEDTDEDIYCVSFPDDLLEAADLKEGDQVEWVDRGDGSYLLKKVTKPLGMDEC